MPLVHRHSVDGKNPKLPTITRPFCTVDSGRVVISKQGKTPMWSTGFSGCIGVVMCGAGPWGAMAHLNQNIQYSNQDLEVALAVVTEFVNTQTKDKIKEVLLYYGDPPHNLGPKKNLNEAKVKEVMKCQKVIDLRRKKEEATWGTDFVYDPGLQLVYTAPGGRTAELTGLTALIANDESKVVDPPKQKFPYADDTKAVVNKGLGHTGWFFVP